MYGRKAAGTFLICFVGPRTLKRYLGQILACQLLDWPQSEYMVSEAQPYSDDITSLQNVLLLPGRSGKLPDGSGCLPNCQVWL